PIGLGDEGLDHPEDDDRQDQRLGDLDQAAEWTVVRARGRTLSTLRRFRSLGGFRAHGRRVGADGGKTHGRRVYRRSLSHARGASKESPGARWESSSTTLRPLTP